MSSTSCRVHLLTAVVFTMWLVVGGAHASDAAASTPISCANVPISDCTALPQCYVDSSTGVRTCATFTTCTAFTTDVTCGSASACSWSQLLKSCVLKSICNQIMSSELCSTTYGCVFNSLAGCVGCNQLSSTQCVAGGCRLNGTVCIPSAPPPAPPHPHTVSVSMSFPLQPGDYCFRMTDTLSCLSVPDCYFSAQNKSCIANRFCSQFTNATSTTSASVAAKCAASGCRYLTATTTPSNTLLLPALCISPTALCALQNTSAKCWNTTGCVYLVPLSQGSAAPPGNCMSESFCPFTSLTTCSFFGCTASLTACTNPPRPTTTTTKPFSSDTTTTMIVSTPAPTSTLQPATTTATTPAPTKASDGTQAPTSAATTATPTSTKHSDQTPAPTTSSSPPTRQQTTTAPSTTTTQAPQQQTTASPTSAPSASDYCARLNDSPKACWAMSGCYFWQKGSQTWCSSGTVCTSVIRADECTSLGCVAKTTTALFGSGIIACVPPSPPAPTCATIATKKLCLANTSCTIQDNATCVERCPSGYVVCPSTGACASSLSRCVVCSSSQVQCWDSSCVDAQGQCPCPTGLFRCREGGQSECVTSAFCTALSQRNCSKATPTLCSDGSCAASLASCPCPSARPIQCNISSTDTMVASTDATGQTMPLCVLNQADCSACPANTVRCWNGNCVSQASGCPCNSSTPVRCPLGLQCAVSAVACPCASSAQSRCPNDPTVCLTDTTTCTSICPTATPTRCGDGSCARSALLCPCVPDASSLPVLTINLGISTFDATIAFRPTVSVNYSVCNRDSSASVDVVWTFMRYGSTQVITPPPGSVVRGILAAIPANTFSPGDQIIAIATGTVNATAGIVGSTKVVLSFTVPAPTITLGGSTIVSIYDPTAAAKLVTATIVDQYKNRDASIHWWCCNVSSWTGMAITSSTPVDNCTTPCDNFVATSVAASCTFKDAFVGKYIVTVSYANVSASQLIIVLANPNSGSSSGTPPPTPNNTSNSTGNSTNTTWAPVPPIIVIPQVPTAVIQTLRSVILASSDISFAVQLSGARWSDGLGYQWLVNGTDVTTNKAYSTYAKVQAAQLYFPAGVLRSAVYNITYVVYAKSFPALMSVDEQLVSVISVPQIQCTVTDPAGDQSNTTARSSSITIKAVFLDANNNPLADGVGLSSIANFAPQFRFGLYDVQNRVDIVRTINTYQDSSFVTTSAPVVASIGSANFSLVPFFVALRLNRAEDVSIANCSRVIYRFVDSVATVVTDAMQNLRTAQSSNQVGTMVSTALSVSTAVALSVSQGIANSTSAAEDTAKRAGQALGNVTNALQSVVNSSSDLLSTEQRSSILTTVDSLVSARIQAVNAASGTATSSATAIDNGTRAQLLSIISQTVSVQKSNSDATTSDTAFNGARDGPTVLRTLDSLASDDNSAASIAKTVAASLASGANFGERPSINSTVFSLVGFANAPASVGGQSVSTQTTSIRLPSNFGNQGSLLTSSVVSVTGTESKSNPYGKSGLPSSKDAVASSVVDFSVFADGSHFSVNGLTEPIQLQFRANASLTSTTSETEGKNLTCFYLNEATGSWSREGVVTVFADNVTGDVVCNTTHLSTFAVMVLSYYSTPTSPSSGSGTNGGSNDDSNTGLIVGVVIAVLVVLVIAIAVFVKIRSSGDAGTGQKSEDIKDGGALLSQPMMEMHGYHDMTDGTGGVIDQGGWNAKPVYQAPDTAAVSIEL